MHLASNVRCSSNSGRRPDDECHEVRASGYNTGAIFVSGCATHVVVVRRPFQSLAGDMRPVHSSKRQRSLTSGDRCERRPQPGPTSYGHHLPHHRCAASSHSAHAAASGATAEWCTDRPVPTTSASAPARSVKCRRVPPDRVLRSPAGVALSIIKRWL